MKENKSGVFLDMVLKKAAVIAVLAAVLIIVQKFNFLNTYLKLIFSLASVFVASAFLRCITTAYFEEKERQSDERDIA